MSVSWRLLSARLARCAKKCSTDTKSSTSWRQNLNGKCVSEFACPHFNFCSNDKIFACLDNCCGGAGKNQSALINYSTRQNVGLVICLWWVEAKLLNLSQLHWPNFKQKKEQLLPDLFVLHFPTMSRGSSSKRNSSSPQRRSESEKRLKRLKCGVYCASWALNYDAVKSHYIRILQRIFRSVFCLA